MTYTRNLIFQSDDLGAEATLLLTFGDRDRMMEGADRYFPVVWRVNTFPAEGSYAMEATYTSQRAFIKPQVENDKVVGAEAFVAIDLGQQTNLMKENGGFFFTEPTVQHEPTPDAEDCIWAYNRTGSTLDLATGTMSLENQPVPYSYYTEFRENEDYGYGKLLDQHLSAYIASGYEEMQLVKGKLQGKLVWKQELADLDELTTWTLTRDPATDEYKITKAQTE